MRNHWIIAYYTYRLEQTVSKTKNEMNKKEQRNFFFPTNLQTWQCVKTKREIEIYERENWKWSEAYRVLRVKKVSRTKNVCILSDIEHKNSISISYMYNFFYKCSICHLAKSILSICKHLQFTATIFFHPIQISTLSSSFAHFHECFVLVTDFTINLQNVCHIRLSFNWFI